MVAFNRGYEYLADDGLSAVHEAAAHRSGCAALLQALLKAVEADASSNDEERLSEALATIQAGIFELAEDVCGVDASAERERLLRKIKGFRTDLLGQGWFAFASLEREEVRRAEFLRWKAEREAAEREEAAREAEREAALDAELQRYFG